MISQYLEKRGFTGWVIKGDEEYANIRWKDGIVLATEAEVIEGVAVLELAKTAEKKRKLGLNYLQETDWYIIRFFENGEPIPMNVINKRRVARIDANL